MTSSLWAIDVGNSAVKIQFFHQGEAGMRYTVPRHLAFQEATATADLLRKAAAGHTGTAMAISASRAADREFFVKLLDEHFGGMEPYFVLAAGHLPFTVRYTSGAAGPDRLCNAMALRALFPGAPALAVDFGTATHITVVDALGDMIGGSIMPGLAVQADSLVTATNGGLPRVDLMDRSVVSPTGNSSVDAIRLGLLMGHVGAVDRLVAELERAVGRPMQRLATGGWAETLLPHSRCGLIWHQNLTLLGLRYFAEWSDQNLSR